MIKYPNGINKTYTEKKRIVVKRKSAANRGMSLEDSINKACEYYKDIDKAIITKRPTPINVVKVDYSRGALITQAYFEKQSTTDYNGIYRGKYLDFEAKSTYLKTSFPLANITPHQIEHLKAVIRHGGIAFFIIEFESRLEAYLLDAAIVLDFWDKGERKSIPYSTIKEKGLLIERKYQPPLDYLKAVDEYYFK